MTEKNPPLKNLISDDDVIVIRERELLLLRCKDVPKVSEKTNDASLTMIKAKALPQTRESIGALIGLMCYSDAALRNALLQGNIDDQTLNAIKERLTVLYEYLGLELPDLSWLWSTKIVVHANDEEHYVVPVRKMDGG